MNDAVRGAPQFSSAPSLTAEAQLRLFIEHLPSAVAMFDREMRYVAASRRWLREYLPGVENPNGCSHYELFPQCPERWRADHRRGLAGEAVRVEEDSWLLPDGSTLWMRYEVKPWPAPDGTIGGIIIVTEDITERRQAEVALQLTSERLEAALSASGVAIFNQDRDLRYTWIHNPQLGYASSWVVGKRDSDLMQDPEDWARLQALKREVIDTGVARREEVRVIHNGASNYYDITLRPQFDAGGNAIGVTCAAIDITSRKATEAALRDIQLRLHIALQSARMGIHAWDPQTERIEWDSRTRDLWGVGPAARITYDTFVSGIHPDDRSAVASAVASATDPAGGGHYDATYRLVHPRDDGATRWVNATGETFFRDGRPIQMIGTVRDVTDQQSMVESLRESEQRFRATFENAAVGIAHVGTEGLFLRVNERFCEISGYSREELLGLTFQQITHPEDLDSDWQQSRQLLAGAVDTYTMEKRYVRKDGSCVPIELTGSLVRKLDGSPDYFIAVIKDIAERKRARDALLDADRKKDQFLAMLAHELRNPLVPIRNAVQILRLLGPHGPQIEKVCEMVARQTGHLTHLVDDLLDVARVSQGKIALKMENFDLAEAVREGVELARPYLEAKNHALTITLPPAGSLWVKGDVTRLAQVLGNLLNNAAKYTDANGTIAVSGEVEADEVVLCVRDNGIGIPAELRPHIFELFTQAERGLDRAQGGLGIGLALVSKLVELHHGQVSVHSEVGQGSAFTVRLPLASAPVSRTVEQSSLASVPRRVLLVDDNVDVATSMRTLLEIAGHRVQCEYSATAAIASAPGFAPDVCLLDIGLPGMNGYELARRLRAMPELSKTRFVALSGYAPNQVGPEAARQFDQYLVKPVEPERLLEALAA